MENTRIPILEMSYQEDIEDQGDHSNDFWMDPKQVFKQA